MKHDEDSCPFPIHQEFFVLLVIVALLLIGAATPAKADGGDNESIGSVWVSVTYGGTGCHGKTVCPSLTNNQIPGGGTAVISAGLEWAALRISGKGETSLSGATQSFTITSRVSLYQNHALVGTDGPYSRVTSGTNSITSNVTRYWNPFGQYWEAFSTGEVFNSGFYWSGSPGVSQQL